MIRKSKCLFLVFTKKVWYPFTRDGLVSNEPAANVDCHVTVTTDGPPDRSTHYDVWRNAAAIVQLCLSQQGKPGLAYGLGKILNFGSFNRIEVGANDSCRRSVSRDRY